MEKITFNIPGEDAAQFYVLEQTMLNGVSYLLVTDKETGDAECWILRDMSQDGEAEAVYELVEDDDELDAVAGVFAQMMDDVDLV